MLLVKWMHGQDALLLFLYLTLSPLSSHTAPRFTCTVPVFLIVYDVDFHVTMWDIGLGLPHTLLWTISSKFLQDAEASVAYSRVVSAWRRITLTTPFTLQFIYPGWQILRDTSLLLCDFGDQPTLPAL